LDLWRVRLGITKSLSGNSVLLDTSSQSGNQAGWSRIAAPPLDRSQGFTLLFTAQLNATYCNSESAKRCVFTTGAAKHLKHCLMSW